MELVELLSTRDIVFTSLDSSIGVVDHIDWVRRSEGCVYNEKLSVADKTDDEIIFILTLDKITLDIETATDITVSYINESEKLVLRSRIERNYAQSCDWLLLWVNPLL